MIVKTKVLFVVSMVRVGREEIVPRLTIITVALFYVLLRIAPSQQTVAYTHSL